MSRVTDLSVSPVQEVLDAAHPCWLLLTQKTAYAMRLDESGRLQHLYWGERLGQPQDYPGIGRPLARYERDHLAMADDEYPAWGGFTYSEPCLKVTFANGTRDALLRYQSHRQEQQSTDLTTLIITLRDTDYPLEVDLFYTVIPEYDLLERRAVIRNTGEEALTIESALSACWQLPTLSSGSYRLTHLNGRWNSETQIERRALPTGRTILESRRGLTSAEANPFFAIDFQQGEYGGATEEQGQVWFGAVGWSGNWKISIDCQSYPTRVSIAGGINDFDWRWQLQPGEVFSTPPFVAGFTTSGLGSVSYSLHGYQLDYVLPRQHAQKPRPVLYNSCEAVHFALTEETQLELARRAARLGVELFVIDDGWFGQRNDLRSSLGDWSVNEHKFPRGLADFIARVHELGMQFGLWLEPEMVNPDSELYRAHPDWIYHFPARRGTLQREQWVLNLARDEVAEYIFHRIDSLLTTYAIAFIKWDFNRPLTEAGWPDELPEHQREVYVRHIHNFYTIVERLRARHPLVLWEVCASGGGRVDLGTLARFDQCWTSDNIDALDRLTVQEGYSLAYAAKTMAAWVSLPQKSEQASAFTPSLSYCFHAAMPGTLGLGDDLRSYTPAEMEEASELIATYKSIRHIVQDGLLYRLISPRHNACTAIQYVSRDQEEAVIFVFLQAAHFWDLAPAPRIFPRGLDPSGLYYLDGPLDEKGPISGQSLMSVGLTVPLTGHFASALITLTQAPAALTAD